MFISGYANTGKNVFYCFYKITFPRKKKNSLFRLLIKREILTSRKVLYTKLNVRVISSCFVIKMLSKKGFFRLKCQLKRKKNWHMFVKMFLGVREIFCRGGGGVVNHLPKKISQVAQIFYERVEKK